jgi:hypothetical protein
VIEEPVATAHGQLRMNIVAPAAILLEGDVDAVRRRAEGVFEEIGRTDAIAGLTAGRRQSERVGIAICNSGGKSDLAARDRERLENSVWSSAPIASSRPARGR